MRTFDGLREPLPADALAEIRDDPRPIAAAPWFTHRRVIFFVIAWLLAFSAGSVFISNPFASEPSAAATPDYWRVMYLHGLLIGMVGLLALLACAVFRLRSRHVSFWIAVGVVVATVAAGVGGIFDKRIPGAEVAMWTQIVGFFALDEILLVLILGMIAEWRRGSVLVRTVSFWTGWLAALSMLAAAIMGHITGWIMEFGSFPGMGGYVKGLGVSWSDFAANLMGSHSHDMVVGVMAFAVALAATQFGMARLRGVGQAVAVVGMWAVAAGTAFMTVVYVVAGFTTWGPPTLFQSAGGTNGIAGDDILTGIFVLGGGLLVMGALVFGRGMLRYPVRLSSAWAWALSFAVVVIAGYAIELHETYFGAGDKAPGAAKDAVFTWLHQDIGLFLLPAVVLVMLVVKLFVAPRFQGRIAWTMITGTTVAFVGGLVFVFVNPAIHGPGYVISTLGLLVVGLALLGTMWWGTIGAGRASDITRPHASGRETPDETVTGSARVPDAVPAEWVEEQGRRRVNR